MRPFVAIVFALAACGRLGFDEGSSTPGPDDGALPDGAVAPNLCNPRVAGTLALNAETPIKARASQLSSGGFAVAVETDATNVYVVRLDASGALVSQHAPMNAGYTLHGISQIADRPFVYVFVGGSAYIKMLVPDWNSYETGPAGAERTIDPQQALLPGGTTAMFGVIDGGQMSIKTIDATGVVDVVADYAPSAEQGSFASTPGGARVVVSNDGQCETFEIAPDGTTGARDAIADCGEPRLAMLDDQHGAILYRKATATTLALYSVAAKTTTFLEPGDNPRITVNDGAIWVAYLVSNKLRIKRFDGIAPPTTTDFPAIGSGVFDLLPTTAFWVDAGGLHVGDPCR